ncbi:Glyco transf 49 domain containing protein [Asbolus verrucosus]|uniref:Beta-1,4-glucuronyltransferase 1 n=1 Tax=Asbolus verrucosus TaxID=1661398 RepID=A0A482W120_ASBVE|nr:Glyco transf 49 domain containing protein [Asbolus verrucosus]
MVLRRTKTKTSQGSCRIWNISILAVVFLSIYNILLTLKLMYTPDCARSPSPALKMPQKAQKCDPPRQSYSQNDPIFKLDLRLGRWDTRLQYKLFDNILVGERFASLSEFHKTCLATQTSLDKIASLIEVSANWNGPISLATFAASDDELNSLLLYILFLRECNAKIREQVSFHFAFPQSQRPRNLNIDFDKLQQMNCANPFGVLQQLVKQYLKGTTKWRTKLPYPQNHLRNLARKNCQSKFVFLTDVDIIPSRNMAEELDAFLEQAVCKGQCAYVIPTYELDDRVRFPPNKTELIRLANKGLARPFHHKVFIYNQFATNFTKWQSSLNEIPEVHISHPVTNFEFLYEPFYVAPDTVPPHDERFVGYGYTRNSQVYEMYVAGYEFLVLSPIFTCHWGLQVKRTRPPWREHQNNLNRKHFDGFKREIFAKYDKDPLHMMSLRKN